MVLMSYYIGKVTTESFEMEYLRFGEGDDILVILPGLSIQSVLSSASAIVKQYEIFSKKYTVYLFDRRNNLPETYSINEMAIDTVEVIKALALKDICLFGVSQGGMIAMVIAIQYPILVKKLVLGSTACKIQTTQNDTIEEWIRLAKEKRPEDLYLSFGKRIYPKELFEKYRRALILLAKQVDSHDLKRFIVLAEGIRQFDVSDRLGEIACPTLLLSDTDDQVLHKNCADEIAKQFKEKNNFKHVVYNGFGHAAYDVAPDYTNRIYDFLIE